MNPWQALIHAVGVVGILLVAGVTAWVPFAVGAVGTACIALLRAWKLGDFAAWVLTVLALSWTLRSPLPGVLEIAGMAVLSLAVVASLHADGIHLARPRAALLVALVAVAVWFLAAGPQLWMGGAARLHDPVTPAAAAARVLGVTFILALVAALVPRRQASGSPDA